MVDFTVSMVSVGIPMVITIGIALCCRFFSDHIETFLVSMPESLIENIKKLRVTAGIIRKIDHLEKKNWLSKVEKILEEARKLLLREYGSSTYNNDDRRFHFCFGYYDSLPIKLQRQVKHLIVKGERILAADERTPDVSDIEKGTANVLKMSELVNTGCDPDMEKDVLASGTAVEKIKASIDIFNAPDSFAGDVEKLFYMMENIKSMKPSAEICRLLSKAEKIMEKYTHVLLNRDGSSSKNNVLQLSCCNFGHRVSRGKLHKKVRELIIQGQNIITLANLTVEPVEHIFGVPNIEDGSTAGRHLSLVMDMLNDDAVWSIGVSGPGGVGKTTLVSAMHNKLKNNSSFTLVRLVPLTKDVDEIQLQKAIAKKLELKVEQGMDTREIADIIFNRLQRENFLLILDNVWRSIDLKRIGIPINQIGSKVMLTTRLENVCIRMEAKAIKIGYLTDTEAWKLFAEKAGDVVTNPEIQPLAKAVCRECGGLPLALVAVGSAMRGKTNIHQWQSAITDLESSIFPDDIESQVYKLLKLSYDFLPNDTLRSCFLYCSLYPEDHSILESELVQCWLAENIIDEQLNYESAYNKGLDLIEDLKNSHLLEEGWSKHMIKMHDVVRDVATRIAKLNGTSIVFSGHGISKHPKISFPQDVENIRYISFVDNEILVLPETKKDFPKVTTLLLSNIKDGMQVPEEFLKGFQALRVLNVWNLQYFSHSLLHLTDLRALLLRDCRGDLEELQCGAKLMVLDLSFCPFYKLPRGIEKLTGLRVLVLSDTRNLQTIEVDAIRNLSALEVLDMIGSGYKWATVRKSESKEVVLQDLSRFKWLKEAYLELADLDATYEESSWMQRLNSFAFYYDWPFSHLSQRRRKLIAINRIKGNEVGSFILHAEIVRLDGIGNLNEMCANFSPYSWSNSKLHSLIINSCSLSKKLTGRVPNFGTLPNLESLSFHSNDQFKSFYQIANVLGTTFPKLRRLDIGANMDLENVLPSDCPHMVMPELEEISIQFCMKMTKVFHDGLSETQAVVPKLKSLRLHNLESLQSLCSCGSSEHWQSLEVLLVGKCPNLMKLPRMTSIKEIRGEEEWWNNLEWDSPETMLYMSQFFKARGPQIESEDIQIL